MSDPDGSPPIFRLAELRRADGAEFDHRPGRETLAELAAELGLDGVSKVRFAGRLSPAADGWDLTATLGATLEQPCVATFAPVRTRIDNPVIRRWRRHLDQPAPGTETEMPEDDTLEPLTDPIDLGAVLREELALAIPPFPRAAAAEPVEQTVTEPGRAPLTDADLRPFAGLAALKDRLENGGDTEQ